MLLSPSIKSGTHWFVLFNFDDTYEVFDSLGSSKSFLLSNIPEFGKYLEFNNTRVQPLDSKECGKYALYFIINRLENLDFHFDELLNLIFTSNCNTNESRVKSFFNSENE